jgi:hypothetical protein
MIGCLPTTLNIDGKNYQIRTDYRDCLTILSAFSDRELSDVEKAMVMMDIIYKDDVPQEKYDKAVEQAVWFLNCGNTVQKPVTKAPLYDFEQDEQVIFSAINRVAGREIRADEYLHFWTFMGLFNEIGECSFSTIVSIRDKKRKHKKLEQWEKDFYRDNKDSIDLKEKFTEEEKEEQSEIDKLLGL